jgi:hypothetical protein
MLRPPGVTLVGMPPTPTPLPASPTDSAHDMESGANPHEYWLCQRIVLILCALRSNPVGICCGLLPMGGAMPSICDFTVGNSVFFASTCA